MSEDTVLARVVAPQFRYDREQYTEGDELEVTEDTLEYHPNEVVPVAQSADNAGGANDGDGDGDGDSGDDPEGEEEPSGEGESEPDGDDGGEDDVEPVAEEDLDPHPSDLTIDELGDRVEDVDDLALLFGILEAEVANEARVGAKDAINSRIDALEG